jgi:hypothetical protein
MIILRNHQSVTNLRQRETGRQEDFRRTSWGPPCREFTLRQNSCCASFASDEAKKRPLRLSVPGACPDRSGSAPRAPTVVQMPPGSRLRSLHCLLFNALPSFAFIRAHLWLGMLVFPEKYAPHLNSVLSGSLHLQKNPCFPVPNALKPPPPPKNPPPVPSC